MSSAAMNLAALNLAIVEAISRLLPERSQPINPDTDLVFDLGLDSVDILQLITRLETECGFSLPDRPLELARCTQVAELAALFEPVGGAPPPPPLDIKVHCVVSCLCHPIKAMGIDQRPLYFGVWDAEVALVDNAITYHLPNIDHSLFLNAFEELYRGRLRQWHAPGRDNLATLARELSARGSHDYVMVMLDLYQLPERENKFQQNPFPHYVLLENMEAPERIWMWDPDFRWEGALERARVFNAVDQPSVGGGWTLDTRELQAAEPQAVVNHFERTFNLNLFPLQQAISGALTSVTAAWQLAPEQAPPPLARALAQLPVLAIRKYAYEHGFAYFWDALGWDPDGFETWCDRIEELVQRFEKIRQAAARFDLAPSTSALAEIAADVDRAVALETEIKNGLAGTYRAWRTLVAPQLRTLEAAAC